MLCQPREDDSLGTLRNPRYSATEQPHPQELAHDCETLPCVRQTSWMNTQISPLPAPAKLCVRSSSRDRLAPSSVGSTSRKQLVSAQRAKNSQ